jgi:hypothetical protein
MDSKTLEASSYGKFELIVHASNYFKLFAVKGSEPANIKSQTHVQASCQSRLRVALARKAHQSHLSMRSVPFVLSKVEKQKWDLVLSASLSKYR